TLYTRAGNFRMGDSGTLQDAAGNEVQGWMMTSIDAQNDVTSTNPNTNVFTDDYTKLLGSKIVRHGTYVETITAKATDYSLTAKSDSTSVFSGDGAKSKSAKQSDVEAAIKDYTFWLQKLKDEPDASSATSISQVSQINFKSGSESIISKDGDQVYAYVNGNKYSQNFLLTRATTELKAELFAADQATIAAAAAATPPVVIAPTYINPADLTNIVPPATTNGAGLTQSQIDAANAAYDKAAGKIATYKALADKLSQIPGLVATMAIDSGRVDAFIDTDTYTASTNNIDMLKGIIQIKSLIPGTEFVISEIGEVSGNAVVQGGIQSTSLAIKGSGTGALQTSKDALSQLITGKQQDVFTPTQLGLDGTLKDFEYSITVYDKELKINKPIPSTPAIPPQVVPFQITGVKTLDELIDEINSNPDLAEHIEARNVNGNLVIQTKDSNYDVEFSSNLRAGHGAAAVPIDVNSNYSGRKGAGAEFIEIVTKVDQTASKGSLQLRLDTLGISDSAFGEFSVDATGLITMKQDGAEFAVGQVAIALFNNNRGLNPVGDNLLAKTMDSGDPVYNTNNNKTAKIEGKTLELSTADLSESLVNLMVFQRAFEANAKSITTSDELLNTLINLKR
ncbi:MAG: flagellar hook-basal body complex protein, partial [Aliarcobacter sp.]|nr:flagellar hook-basal body complex protein [Aliarcobacter sp.]